MPAARENKNAARNSPRRPRPSRPRDFRGMRHRRSRARIFYPPLVPALFGVCAIRWRLTDCFPCVFRTVDIEKPSFWRRILSQPRPFFRTPNVHHLFYRSRARSTQHVPEPPSEMSPRRTAPSSGPPKQENPRPKPGRKEKVITPKSCPSSRGSFALRAHAGISAAPPRAARSDPGPPIAEPGSVPLRRSARGSSRARPRARACV